MKDSKGFIRLTNTVGKKQEKPQEFKAQFLKPGPIHSISPDTENTWLFGFDFPLLLTCTASSLKTQWWRILTALLLAYCKEKMSCCPSPMILSSSQVLRQQLLSTGKAPVPHPHPSTPPALGGPSVLEGMLCCTLAPASSTLPAKVHTASPCRTPLKQDWSRKWVLLITCGIYLIYIENILSLTQCSFEMLFDNQRGKTRKDFNFHVLYLQAAQYILYTNGLK